MNAALWVLVAAFIVLGVAGTVLPALPGVVFVFVGIALAAWIDGFSRIAVWTVAICGVLAVLGFVVDYVATVVFARRADASPLGLLGAVIGTLAGVFTGLLGLVFMPLAGAAIGEFIARRDALRAGKVGLATWVGLLAATAAKIAIVFTMLGIFVAALLW